MNVSLVINHYQVTAPCNISLLNDYTYTLLQRDYCQQPLNSSEINTILDDIDDTTPNTVIPISVNVQSLILKSTWSISVQVSNRFGNDSTTYTNITNTGNAFLIVINLLLISIGFIQQCHPHYSLVNLSLAYSTSSITSLSSILPSSNDYY